VDDPRQRRPDISRARTLLHWEPKIDLESGLRLCLEYFRNEVAGTVTAGSAKAPIRNSEAAPAAGKISAPR
jgi:hypothetical protein